MILNRFCATTVFLYVCGNLIKHWKISFKDEGGEDHLSQYWLCRTLAGTERSWWCVCTLEDKYLGVCRVSQHLPSLSCPDRTLRSSQAFKLELSGPGSQPASALLSSLPAWNIIYQPVITSNVFLWSKYHHQGWSLHFRVAWCTKTLFW